MKSVLVVDDEPQLVRALQVNLQEEGYSVTPPRTVRKHCELQPISRRT